MSRLFFIFVMVLASLGGPRPADAVQPSRPQAEYSADSMIQNEEGTMKQRVYVTPTKERKEMLTGAGDGAVQIFRYDTKVMWQIMPSEKMYMEHSIAGKGQGNDPSQWTYEDTRMGEETLNGVNVTKYKTIATSTDGKKYGGFSWRTIGAVIMVYARATRSPYLYPLIGVQTSVVPQDLNNFDPHLWVYDKTSGEMLAEMELPANATGAPMTYMAGGKQYVAFPVGGSNIPEELIAVTLP